MKCQGLFSGEYKKNIINWSSAEFVQTVVKFKTLMKLHYELNVLDA